MKQHIKNLRRVATACDALNNLVLEIMMFAFLLVVVAASLLWLWWYPINYLTEGDQFHERRVTKYMKCVGFEDVAHVSFDMPSNHYRDFETTCAAWVTSDDGKTYHPIEFTYSYERRAWLEGKSSLSPTLKSFADNYAGVFAHYLDWYGITRKQLGELLGAQASDLSE